jgi:chromosome segregation ATPase
MPEQSTAYSKLSPSESRRQRIADLEGEISSLVTNKRHYEMLLDGNGARTRATIAEWQQAAQSFEERATRLQEQLGEAYTGVEYCEKRIAECRATIAQIKSEREVNELLDIVAQIKALTTENPTLQAMVKELEQQANERN